jgi:hypothetical protein
MERKILPDYVQELLVQIMAGTVTDLLEDCQKSNSRLGL